MPTSNDVINQQYIQRFTCKTCQTNFIDKYELMHHRKGEYPSNIGYNDFFFTNICRKSSNQVALCWFSHEQLLLSDHNEAINTPGVATSVFPLWNINFPSFSRHEPEFYVRTTAKNGDCDATAETPTAAPG